MEADSHVLLGDHQIRSPLPASAVPIYCDDSPQIVFNELAGTWTSQVCSL
jgi:hypothetical protein